MLDLIEETLNQMSLLVKMAIIIALFFAVFARRDHRHGIFFGNLLQEILRIVRAIRNYPLKIEFCYQVFSLRNIMALSTSQKIAQWIAQSIYAGVDLGAETASATSKCLAFLPAAFFSAPAAHGWARTTVLSNKIFSISGSPAKC